MYVDDDALEPDAFEYDEDEFVPAFFARDMEEAEEYCELLADHDVPARLGTDDDLLDDGDAAGSAGRPGMTRGVPVLVPEPLLDEASEIIADREEFADFEDEEEEADEEEADDEEFGMGAVDDEDELLDEEDEDDDELFDDEDLDDLAGLDGEEDDEYF